MTPNQELLHEATETILTALWLLAENQQYVANGKQPPHRFADFDQAIRAFSANFKAIADKPQGQGRKP